MTTCRFRCGTCVSEGLGLFAALIGWMPQVALAWAGVLLVSCTRPEAAAIPGEPTRTATQQAASTALRGLYSKREVSIVMRDGVKLFTNIYSPRDTSQPWPILMRRTPYSSRPYGEDTYPESLGPSKLMFASKYIFVCQDVRGAYMSEGEFVDMRPMIETKSSERDVDESTDAWDTIDWLVNNVANNNGRVGMYGISYPGFYAAAGMIDAHPALKAVSPQAPIADWFFDDFHHHGALFLPHAFNFLSWFGLPRPEPTTSRPRGFDHKTKDGYQFFLDLGPLSNVNGRYFHEKVKMWNDLVAHPNYDAFWQARNILPHLQQVAPAVMTVGGWFDAEDLYGALSVYRSVEQQNPDVFNVLVMGPWSHGGWAGGSGRSLGNVDFGAKTAERYRTEIEFPFFEHFLKDKGQLALPEASVFDTGANRWRSFVQWPPQEMQRQSLFLHAQGHMDFAAERNPDRGDNLFAEFVSDPTRPVPYSQTVSVAMERAYMTDDQRFAEIRPDVRTWKTGVLTHDVTLAGPLTAELLVSTTGTDADWIVKLIDAFPIDATDSSPIPTEKSMSGYQMMVRSEVIRGRFRNSLEHPEPFTPNEKTLVRLPLQDVLHTFQKGHRIAVQVQCSWFPLVDRNPQTYVENVFLAREEDFVKATQRVWHGSHLRVGVLPAK